MPAIISRGQTVQQLLDTDGQRCYPKSHQHRSPGNRIMETGKSIPARAGEVRWNEAAEPNHHSGIETWEGAQ
jgi:hypothetical protein